MKEVLKYSWAEFDSDCKKIAAEILKRKNFPINSIYYIPRGGMAFALRLAHLLDIGNVQPITAISTEQNYCIVCDDVSDSGKQLLKSCKLFDLDTCVFTTLFVKPKTRFMSDVYARITDSWIEFPWEAKDES
jgi:hypoxanthine phosphoribosyltransferase